MHWVITLYIVIIPYILEISIGTYKLDIGKGKSWIYIENEFD